MARINAVLRRQAAAHTASATALTFLGWRIDFRLRELRNGRSAHYRCRKRRPGISDAQKQNMPEPFVRGDDARNMDEATGFGLRAFLRQHQRARAWPHADAARPEAARPDRAPSAAGSPAEPCDV